MVHEAVIDATFAALDTSGDGTVSRAELAKAVRSSAVLAAMLGVPHELREAGAPSGPGGPGAPGAPSPLYAFNAAFDAADANHDGRLTKDELRAFFRGRGSQ
jgi:Ca2+-binding EF-hand superfamily protein